MLGVGDNDRKIQFFSIPALSPVAMSASYNSPVTTSIFDSGGQVFITGHADGSIHFTEVFTNSTSSQLDKQDGSSAPKSMVGHKGKVSSLSLHPSLGILASGGYDGTIRLWHVNRHQPLVPPDKASWGVGTGIESFTGALVDTEFLESPEPHGVPVLFGFEPDDLESPWAFDRPNMNVAFTGDGRSLVSTFYESQVQIWELPVGKPLHQWRRGPGEAQIASDADVVANYKGSTAIVTSLAGQQYCQANLGMPISEVSLDQFGHTLLVASKQLLQVFDVGSAKPVSPLLPSGTASALSADGKMVCVATTDNAIRVSDVRTGHLVGKAMSAGPGSVYCLAFGSGGRRLGAGTDTGSVYVYDISSGKELYHVGETTNSVAIIAFDSASNLLASADKSGIYVWDSSTGGRRTPVLAVPSEPIVCLRFSHDGSLLAAGFDDHTIRLWHLPSGQQVGPALDAHQSALSVGFSLDDKTLSAITPDLPPQRFALSASLLTEMIADRTGRNLTYREWERYLGTMPYRTTFPQFGVHESVLNEAERLATEGRREEALHLYRTAQSLQPSLNIDPEKAVELIRLVVDAESKARKGEVQAAILSFTNAKALGWSDSTNIEGLAKALAAEALTSKGYQLAQLNETKEAAQVFDEARPFIDGANPPANFFVARIEKELLQFGSASYARHVAV
jgi:WD40 repeat protein